MQLTPEMQAILRLTIEFNDLQRDRDTMPVGSGSVTAARRKLFELQRAIDRLPADQRVAIAGNRTRGPRPATVEVPQTNQAAA